MDTDLSHLPLLYTFLDIISPRTKTINYGAAYHIYYENLLRV